MASSPDFIVFIVKRNLAINTKPSNSWEVGKVIKCADIILKCKLCTQVDRNPTFYLQCTVRMRSGRKEGSHFKWLNGVSKSEMSISWCISITNNVVKFQEQTLGRRRRSKLAKPKLRRCVSRIHYKAKKFGPIHFGKMENRPKTLGGGMNAKVSR